MVGDSGRERVMMERALAALLASGGALALVSSLMPQAPEVQWRVTAGLALLGFPGAAILLASRGRLAAWWCHVMLSAGGLITTAGVYFAGPTSTSTAAASFYAWVALYAMYFYRRRIGFAYLGVMGALYAGVLIVQDKRSGAGEWILVMGTSTVAGLVVGRLAHQVRMQARIDALTGIPNRRGFDETLARELARAARSGRTLSVAILDLDHFKALNDSAGHQAGDELLRAASIAWQQAIRSHDVLARVGGDEFVALFPDCDAATAETIIARLRDGSPRGAQFSCGIATAQPDETPPALLVRADGALYEAKRAGRARTAIAA